MARGLGAVLVSLIAASSALMLGLAGAALRTGRLDPLDWLFPVTLAICAVTFFAARGGRDVSPMRLGMIWALMAVPALFLLFWAGVRAPLTGMALLAAMSGLAVTCIGLTRSFARARRVAILIGLIVAALLVPRLVDYVRDGRGAADAARPRVAVLSALPLQGVPMGAAQGLPAAEAIGLRSPVWAALERQIDLRALDGLAEAELAGVERILLAQPRALTPAELVALDAWVRRGGEVVILSDPLLHWPDPRPLAHPARAPLTSLLDPLLTHWGLQLKSAEIPVEDAAIERRALASGAMVQLAGASRFTTIGSGPSCVLSDEGLIARCRIGAGRALLMADADWINDTLWTLSPDQPLDRRARTSDAVALLDAWLRGEGVVMDRWTTWIAGEDALIVGVRFALLLMLLLAVGDWLLARGPSLSRHSIGINMDQTENINKTSRETG